MQLKPIEISEGIILGRQCTSFFQKLSHRIYISGVVYHDTGEVHTGSYLLLHRKMTKEQERHCIIRHIKGQMSLGKTPAIYAMELANAEVAFNLNGPMI